MLYQFRGYPNLRKSVWKGPGAHLPPSWPKINRNRACKKRPNKQFTRNAPRRAGLVFWKTFKSQCQDQNPVAQGPGPPGPEDKRTKGPRPGTHDETHHALALKRGVDIYIYIYMYMGPMGSWAKIGSMGPLGPLGPIPRIPGPNLPGPMTTNVAMPRRFR